MHTLRILSLFFLLLPCALVDSIAAGDILWSAPPVGYRARLNPRRPMVMTFGQHSISTYSLNGGAFLKSIYVGEGSVLGASWSPDGNVIAACFDDGVVRFYNANQATMDEELRVSSEAVFDASWSADGAILACTTIDSVFFIDLNTMLPLRSIASGGFSAVSWRPGSKDECIIMTFRLSELTSRAQWYNVSSDSLISTFEDSVVVNAQWSPQGSNIACMDFSGAITIWSAKSKTPISYLAAPEEHEGDIHNMAWLSAKTLLRSAGNIAHSYVIPEGTPDSLGLGRVYSIAGLEYNANSGNLLLSSTGDIIEVANLKQNPIESFVWKGHGDKVHSAVLLDGEKALSAGNASLQVYLLDEEEQHAIPAIEGRPMDILRHPSLPLVAICVGTAEEENAHIRIINTQTFQLVAALPGHLAAFHPDGKRLVSYDGNRVFRTYNTTEFMMVDSVQTDIALSALLCDPSSSNIFLRTTEGSILAVDSLYHPLRTYASTEENNINPHSIDYVWGDNLIVALLSNQNMVRAYDAATAGSVRFSVELGNRVPTTVAAHPAGAMIAIGTKDGNIILYNVRHQKSIGEISFGYPVSSLSWNAGGTQLIVGGLGGAVSAYSLGTLADVEEKEDSQSMYVSPLPGHDVVFLHLKEETTATEYTVTNILGQTIYKASLDRGYAIDISSWERGTYFLHLNNRTARIVKQ